MPSEARERWFTRMVEAGLAQFIFEPSDVLTEASPEVLANHLPPELMSQMLQASLAAGAMTPERVLETVTPALLSKHVPHEVLWSCISKAAERSGITRDPNAEGEEAVPTPTDEKGG